MNGDKRSLRSIRPKRATRPSNASVVPTRGLTDEGRPATTEGAEEHRKEHAALAKLSRNGRQNIATHSGHHVQLDEPELVIKAIREAVAASRR